MGSRYPTLSAKNKDALRMGHPRVVVNQEKEKAKTTTDPSTPAVRLRSGSSLRKTNPTRMGSRYPTLAQKTRTRLGWGTLVRGEPRRGRARTAESICCY